jgi:RNA polymerase-binding protein DksA
MENVRRKLVEELESVQRELARIEDQLQERGDYGFGKGDPAVYQWEFNLSLRDRYQKHLEQVQAALVRFDEGRFGICVDCGKPIEEERLEALPFTSVCIACARKHP